MRVRPTLLLALALPWLATWDGTCHSQPAAPTCALTDRACVDENYSRMCFDKDATPSSCGTWLRPFERSPDTGVRNSVAGIYLIAEGHWQASDPQPWFKERAAALIHGILEEDPENAEALFGLALLAPTNEER